MKRTTIIALAGAVIPLALSIATASAEPLTSPKAKKGPVVTASAQADPELVHGRNFVGEAAKAKVAGHPVVPGSDKNDPELVRCLLRQGKYSRPADCCKTAAISACCKNGCNAGL